MPPSRGGPQPERDWSTLRSRESWKPAGENIGTSREINDQNRGSSSCLGSSETSANSRGGSGECGGGGGQCLAAGFLAASSGSGGAGATSSKATYGNGGSPSCGASVTTSHGQGVVGDRAGRAIAVGAVGGSESSEFSMGAMSRNGFRTDAEISSRGDLRGSTSHRDLKRFDFASYTTPASGLDGTLEELGGGKRGLKAWDQFKVNEEKFGVVSTFKADLSQYTTVLDKKKVTREMRQAAERIAREVEKGGSIAKDEEYCEDGDVDEEDLFSAVPRISPEKCAAPLDAGTSDAAGKALLASLRAAPGAAKNTDSDHRALVAPKVQDWWRARRSAGASVPQGAEVALVCPFSHRVLGDVSQLVTHWASALPRAVDLEGSGETPSMTASQHFGRLAQELRWSEMSAMAGLEPTLPINMPRPGSVWEQILARVSRDHGSGNRGVDGGSLRHRDSCEVADRPVSEFIAEAVRLRCWRRDQKIEHRAVMEGIAAGLAIYALSTSLTGSAAAWDTVDDSEVAVVSKRVVGMCH
mmetsp:Transcript_102191/g.256193  ORF Transcript_102191/g.256193 Transcript_102191/m.256193 type:complete len:527 (+) Transcript_102191:51-1631(+)